MKMDNGYENFLNLFSDDGKIDFERLDNTALKTYLSKMAETEQNPTWHGEGDVLTHTKAVCDEIIRLDGFSSLPCIKKKILLVAALLHDIGKTVCTRVENGEITSRGHAKTGARMARELFRRDFGICGNGEALRFSESVCSLIKYHSYPVFATENKDPARELLKIASEGELDGYFDIGMLCMLSRADIEGRISDGSEAQLENIFLCEEFAKQYGCFDKPFEFPDAFSRYAYFNGTNIIPGQTLYDDSWGEVVLMSGLPGTGKDTWISKNCALDMISLDEIRKHLGISPRDNQGRVINEAVSRAKILLRRKQPFVWNATNITSLQRSTLIRLFTDYKARVRIVYLDTGWNNLLSRNSGRRECLPEKAIYGMLSKLEIPQTHESHNVEWICV